MAERSWTGVNSATPRWAQLGQAHPTDTNAASIYSPASNVVGFIKGLLIANTSGGAVVATVYLDINGTTYDATTTILEKSIATDDYLQLDFSGDGMAMPDTSGNLAVKAATGSTLTFTVWGKELIFNG